MTTSEPQPEKLWSPSPERIRDARITAFTKWLARTRGLQFQNYESLWEWSVTDLEGFWAAVWEYFDIRATRPYQRVLADEGMPFTRWFEGAELNFVTQVFHGREGSAAAIRFDSEALGTGTLSWAELETQVAALAATLRALGVRPGDRVAAILPNVPHSVIAFLAVASIGAVWSVCAPDMGPVSIMDRFRQIEPVVLIACDGYRFGGKDYDRRDVLAQVLAALPTVRSLIAVPLVGRANAKPLREVHTLSWAETLVGRESLRVAPVPFEHPLWILYSSGTTGLPKAIVHGHGGILLNGFVMVALHSNLAPGDLLLWLSSTAWVVWNIQVMALSAGVTIFQFDGAVTGQAPAPDWGHHIWDVVGRNGVTAFGTGAAFFAACLKAGVRPRERADLSTLQSISSTGSPLSPDCYRWIYADVKPDVWLANVSGGTDLAGPFLAGNPTLPVYVGEMQCRSLGAAVLAFDECGRSTMNEVGELVCTRPIPSMPIGFWNDLDGKRYLESYFETFAGERGERIWRHGDWLRLTQRPESVTGVIYGRSDATINRQGVRMGTAEFYRVVEAFPEIADSLVVDLEYLGREPHLTLFIVVRNTAELTPDLDRRIRGALREALSPRHVPNEIVRVPSVPRTLTGKKLEVPVRRLLLGQPVEKVVCRDSLANPASLDWYIEFATSFLAGYGSGPGAPVGVWQSSSAAIRPSNIVMLDAAALADAIQTRQVSCVEVMRAYLDHIEKLNPRVNAIVALQDRALLLAQSEERDGQIARGELMGPLHGFPLAVKDLMPVRGIRMTMGSPILRDFIPNEDDIMVERLRTAGAIFIGKTNTPEFGLGSNTYNQVYGPTRNAYDQSRSAGGSSGGAAVSLALRMLPVADGSDYGGSLRNPAGWNNVFGFRTSVGLVPTSTPDGWLPSMDVVGPMARNVADLAMLLSVQAGYDSRVPLSTIGDGSVFQRRLAADFHGKRIAWSGDFGGYLPFEPGVLDVCRSSLKIFESMGCVVQEAQPDYSIDAVWRAWLKLRAWQAGGSLLVYYNDPAKRALMKPEAIYEVESGLKLTAFEISAASVVRTEWYQAVRRFFEKYDYFIVPTAQLFPFDVNTHWPKEIAGKKMQTYHEWMKCVVPITMAGCPALAAPAGFGVQGLPIGIQIVGPTHAELACLQLAHAYDTATNWSTKRLPLLLGQAYS